MVGQRKPGRGALILRDSRAVAMMRLQRKARRLRNIVFLVLFVALFLLGFNQASVSGNYPSWSVLAAVSIVLALFPLSALLIDIFDINGTPRSIKGQNVLFFLLCAIFSTAAATAILYGGLLFGFLSTPLSYYIGSYFILIALVTAVLIFLVRRRLPLPVFRQAGKQMLIALALAALLYTTLGQIPNVSLPSLTFYPTQIWSAPIFFVVIWPLALLDEGICRGYQEHGVVRALLASTFFKALLLAGLAINAYFAPGLKISGSLLVLLAIIFACLVALGAQIYSSGRAAITSATFYALILAWYLASAFPIK